MNTCQVCEREVASISQMYCDECDAIMEAVDEYYAQQPGGFRPVPDWMTAEEYA